ncbi:hypothetical protein BFS06_14150 [Clostridium perfringens]|uniref:Putative transcriptional regulator n=1 Tax=Clostridium perfringens TaxID=1502 RepID=A0A140GRI2_CLOPF|nr:helix-turn-helix transcriptional regulator [Clostridium perfringens]AMN31141.1 putative transcriptional regulator [Clostridium perfringens]TBX14349.1 hypothetical protein BFS06_14150 [Clostridium perfringens]
MNLSEFLKEKREESFISINELAGRIGVNPSIISRLESGETKNKSIDLIRDIFNELNIDSQYISDYFNENKEEKTCKFSVEKNNLSKSDECFICSKKYDLRNVKIGINKPIHQDITICKTCRAELAKELLNSCY